ncbi:MAG: L,D-transpeptidase, partial [Pseudomonadota bacterium]|nr:L,D-transpeptidase [Pseudomonadota bacterium]
GSSLADERSWSPGDAGRPVDADASSAARQMTAWVLETADNQGLPFLIIDKINAEVSAFDREGQHLGTSPALLGLARGDVSPAGIGDRPLSAIAPGERVTPAGRFLASMGENLGGKGILWIDYDAALSLHPVVTTRAADRRLQRLASATAEDNRISYGCVNVSRTFYDEVVQLAFNGTTGIVYILPETRSLADVFFPASGAGESAPGPAGPPLD